MAVVAVIVEEEKEEETVEPEAAAGGRGGKTEVEAIPTRIKVLILRKSRLGPQTSAHCQKKMMWIQRPPHTSS